MLTRVHSRWYEPTLSIRAAGTAVSRKPFALVKEIYMPKLLGSRFFWTFSIVPFALMFAQDSAAPVARLADWAADSSGLRSGLRLFLPVAAAL